MKPAGSLIKLLPISLFATGLTTLTVLLFAQLAKLQLYSPDSTGRALDIAAPFIGAILLIGLFRYFSPNTKSGLPLVVIAYHFNSGRLDWKNAVYQMAAAATALISGFAVGAVGPAVHIGAASANMVGQLLSLPERSLRILSACGAASAFSVLFHTPITGIFFAFETIIRRFYWRTFIFVTISAFFAAWMARQTGAYEFHIDAKDFQYQLSLIPELALLGAVCGLLATYFLKLIRFTAETLPFPYWGKFLFAAAVTSLAGLFGVEVLGLGDEVLTTLIYESPTSYYVLTWLFLRYLISAIAIGAAIPGGALGPCLVLGAITGHLASLWLPNEAPQLFVLVGMSAFLGSVLKSPIAAVLLVVETTLNLSLAFPCIVGTLSAYLVQSRFFKQQNLIELLLARQKILLSDSPRLKGKH